MKMMAPFLIVGMGKSGQAALRLLGLLGVPRSACSTFDAKPGLADLSKPEQALALKPKTLVVSPGFDLKTHWLQTLLKTGAELTSELDLACQQLTSEKVIGVTGSMGKSTTTSLLAVAARAFDANSFAGGNLGFPLADYVSDVLEKTRGRATWIVLELSSYQLENCRHLKTHVSVLTALSQNHLERYAGLEDYYGTKWTLLARTQGSFYLNFENSEVVRWCQAKLTPKCIPVTPNDSLLVSLRLSESQLIGRHNQQNLAIAARIALDLKWPPQALQALKDYRGLEHRLEFVSKKNQLLFINDSKATTVQSVLAAVDSCLDLVGPTRFLILLAGGRDKGLPWEDLGTLRTNSSVKVLFFGECGGLAQQKSKLEGPHFPSLKKALEAAQTQAGPGDVVLLSPGGSSHDEFQNFEQRGDFFKSWVKSLEGL
ncbi:MAG: UDP-N-acetylmuramoyl-L-alanine--D-glutamate ligase [Bdellovibrionales bacterium]